MKKGFFSVVILFIGGIIFSGCIKNTPHITTTNPSMTANIGSYTFVAATVVTAILDTQLYDTSTTLVITGNTSDRANPYDKIQLTVSNFRGTTGVFSMVQSQASGIYFHSGEASRAAGGIVAITSYTPTTIIGYFSFNTYDTIQVKNGSFIANRP